ncbi:unnamed protein product [Amoebophrya sp. A25]|nr:unnamed protein product [Amoebophrya sp. A25]|eukprot:GSA25T00025160001.1
MTKYPDYTEEQNAQWAKMHKHSDPVERAEKFLDFIAAHNYDTTKDMVETGPPIGDSVPGVKLPSDVDLKQGQPLVLDKFYRLGCVVRDELAGGPSAANNLNRIEALKVAKGVLLGRAGSPEELDTTRLPVSAQQRWQELVAGGGAGGDHKGGRTDASITEEDSDNWVAGLAHSKICNGFQECYDKTMQTYTALKLKVGLG